MLSSTKREKCRHPPSTVVFISDWLPYTMCQWVSAAVAVAAAAFGCVAPSKYVM